MTHPQFSDRLLSAPRFSLAVLVAFVLSIVLSSVVFTTKTQAAAPSADLTIGDITATPSTVVSGSAVSYSITMENLSSGGSHAENAKFTSTIPSGLTYVSGVLSGGTDNSSGTCSVTSGILTCILVSPDSKLQSGNTAIFTVVFTAPACDTTVTLTATTSHDGTDTDSGNDSASEAITVTGCSGGGSSSSSSVSSSSSSTGGSSSVGSSSSAGGSSSAGSSSSEGGSSSAGSSSSEGSSSSAESSSSDGSSSSAGGSSSEGGSSSTSSTSSEGGSSSAGDVIFPAPSSNNSGGNDGSFNGSARGHNSNRIFAALNQLAALNGLGGNTPPPGFGGSSRIPLSQAELKVICTAQRVIDADAPEDLFAIIANAMATIMGRDADFIQEMLHNTSICETFNASLRPQTLQAFVETRPVTLALDGYPVSGNEVWNLCVRGQATLQDIKNNEDVYATRSGRIIPKSCDAYNYTSSNDWKFPEDPFLTLTITPGAKGKQPIVRANAGYVVIPSTQLTASAQ